MRLRSFRWRLALLSMGMSGLVLAAFGISCWGWLYRSNLDRIDRELRMMGLRELSRPPGGSQWARLEDGMRFALNDDRTRRPSFIVLVKDTQDRIVHTSPAWPAELPAAAFPVPSRAGQFLPVDAGRRPPRSGFRDDSRPQNDVAPPPGQALRPPRRPPPDGLPPPPGEAFLEDRPDANPQPPPPPPLRRPQFATQQAGARLWRIGVFGTPDLTLVMGLGLDEFTAGMRQVRNAFLVALPIALLLIAEGSLLLARRALAPVTVLADAVECITAQGLNQRVPEANTDQEFRRLVADLNRMLERLERSFSQALRFSADAAHELKTPLAILQGQLEQALRQAEPDSDAQRVYAGLAAEVQRLKAIVQKLLLLARADAGQLALRPEPVDLSAMLAGICEDIPILAARLELRQELARGVVVMADPGLLTQALHNLVDNAIRHNRGNGWLRLVLRRTESGAQVTVANSADPIPAADAERIFERFYRVDAARTREGGGAGLGLSLVREIARAHGGDVVLSHNDGDRVEFTLSLPRGTVPTTGAVDRVREA